MSNHLVRWFRNVLIGIDQFGNALANGNPDETISSRIGRLKKEHGGRVPWHHPLARLIDDAAEVIQPGHTDGAIEPWTDGDPVVSPVHGIVCKKCGEYQSREVTPPEIEMKSAFRFCRNCNCLKEHTVGKFVHFKEPRYASTLENDTNR